MPNFRATNDRQGRDETFKFRLSTRLRYFAEIAARAQGLSMANYVETLLEADWPHAQIARCFVPEGDEPEKLGDIADELWSEDDQERFWKRVAHPWTLSSEDLKLRELIYCTPGLRGAALTEHWQAAKKLVLHGNTEDIELLKVLGDVDWRFILINDKERNALYKADPEALLKRVQIQVAARKRGMEELFTV